MLLVSSLNGPEKAASASKLSPCMRWQRSCHPKIIPMPHSAVLLLNPKDVRARLRGSYREALTPFAASSPAQFCRAFAGERVSNPVPPLRPRWLSQHHCTYESN